jgi:hypothetical protein
MDIRKIAVVGGFAVGAAVAFAPLASADDLTGIVDSEISSLNSVFTEETTLAGVPSADITGGGTGVFDTIIQGDIASVESNATFDELVYGFNASNLTSDPGAYDVLNGAVSKFDDALNIGVYALENNGAMLPTADFATDLFGSTSSLTTELAGTTATQAITDLLGNSFSDLLGYF